MKQEKYQIRNPVSGVRNKKTRIVPGGTLGEIRGWCTFKSKFHRTKLGNWNLSIALVSDSKVLFKKENEVSLHEVQGCICEG